MADRVLVTGGASGPGRAIALLTHPDGCRSAFLKRLGLTDGQVRRYWTRLRVRVDDTAEKGDR